MKKFSTALFLTNIFYHCAMTPHLETYCNHFGFDIASWIPCEICGTTAVDIHHIHARGMGGTTQVDHIDNLMALCRPCHHAFGDKEQFMEMLDVMHTYRMMRHRTKNQDMKKPV